MTSYIPNTERFMELCSSQGLSLCRLSKNLGRSQNYIWNCLHKNRFSEELVDYCSQIYGWSKDEITTGKAPDARRRVETSKEAIDRLNAKKQHDEEEAEKRMMANAQPAKPETEPKPEKKKACGKNVEYILSDKTVDALARKIGPKLTAAAVDAIKKHETPNLWFLNDKTEGHDPGTLYAFIVFLKKHPEFVNQIPYTATGDLMKMYYLAQVPKEDMEEEDECTTAL